MSIRLEVTKEAQTQVRELIKVQKPGTAVRLFAQPAGAGGGCGCGDADCGSASPSTAFGLSFDRPRNGDEVVQVDGFSVVVDAQSAAQLDGARIDFVQSLDATGFQITAPNQVEPTAPIGSGCGCGSGGCC